MGLLGRGDCMCVGSSWRVVTTTGESSDGTKSESNSVSDKVAETLRLESVRANSVLGDNGRGGGVCGGDMCSEGA